MRGLELKENGALVDNETLYHFIVSRLLPASLDRCPRGFTGHVAHPVAPFCRTSSPKYEFQEDEVKTVACPRRSRSVFFFPAGSGRRIVRCEVGADRSEKRVTGMASPSDSLKR